MRLSDGGFGGKFGGTELAAEGWRGGRGYNQGGDKGIQEGRHN
jgi:hypothetical protein